MRSILFFALFIFAIFATCPVSAQILNGEFSYAGELEHWTTSTTGNASQVKAGIAGISYPGGSPPSMSIKVVCMTEPEYGIAEAYQTVNVTGYSKLTFKAQISKSSAGTAEVNIGSATQHLSGTGGAWNSYEVDIIGTGNQIVQVYASMSGSGNAIIALDTIYLIPNPTLSGYIKDDEGNGLNTASISLDQSGGSTTSNEIGYYELIVNPNTYAITVSKPGYQDYSGSVSVSSDTNKNVTLSKEPPTLTSLSILDSGDNSLLLGWKESLGADGVYVYVDSQTNLVATVETPYTNIKMYDLTNLEPGTSYNIWCKPYKDDMQGSMYYVSGTTTGDGGGGGGGGAVEVLPPYEDIQPEIPEYPVAYDMTNITSSDLITLAVTNPEVIYKALSNITIKSPLPDKPGDNLLYFYLFIISVCSTLFSSKKEGWEVVTIISIAVVIISLIKLGWI